MYVCFIVVLHITLLVTFNVLIACCMYVWYVAVQFNKYSVLNTQCPRKINECVTGH